MSAYLRDKLQAGRVYGTLVTANSPVWPGMLARTGLDFVFIDTEHVPLDRETVSWMCRTYGALGLAPVVRIGSPCPVAACQMLDGGAAGVIAPYVETPDQVRALVGAVKHRPVKGGRLPGVIAGGAECEPALRTYLDRRNSAQLCIVNIESTPALERLDEILAVDGLDVVLIGPHDLSCSLGVPEQYDHPRFRDAVGEIIGRARDRGVGAGIHMVYGGVEEELAWARAGCNFIVHSGDIFLVERWLRRDIAELRQRLGDGRVDADEGPGVI